MARRPAKKRIISVDFSNVDESGGSFRIPEGSYRMKVVSVEEETSSNDNDMLSWKFEGVEGKAKGKLFWYHTVLNEQSLWNLRGLLQAFGDEVPLEPQDLDLDEMIGKELIGIVTDETYRSKISSKMTDFEAAEEEEEEEPTQSRRTSKKSTKKKEPDKIAADEVRAMKEDELEDVIKTYELEVDFDEHKTLRRKVNAVLTALEEADMLDA